MYNESDFINLDIFKALSLFKHLEKYNNEIIHISKTIDYSAEGHYDVNKNQASFWFDHTKYRHTPLPVYYPEIIPLQLHPSFNLIIHLPNYFILMIMDVLYPDRKVNYEDICCGMGNLIFYLSKMGFKSFHGIDNWTQVPRHVFEMLMAQGGITYELNNMAYPAMVSSLVAYPHWVKVDGNGKAIIHEKTELILSYVKVNPGNNNLKPIDNDKFFTEQRFMCLAKDPLQVLYAYCREDKYKEFKEKLKIYDSSV